MPTPVRASPSDGASGDAVERTAQALAGERFFRLLTRTSRAPKQARMTWSSTPAPHKPLEIARGDQHLCAIDRQLHREWQRARPTGGKGVRGIKRSSIASLQFNLLGCALSGHPWQIPGGHCRFHPSGSVLCSAAYQQTAHPDLWLTLRRFGRCHPLRRQRFLIPFPAVAPVMPLGCPQKTTESLLSSRVRSVRKFVRLNPGRALPRLSK